EFASIVRAEEIAHDMLGAGVETDRHQRLHRHWRPGFGGGQTRICREAQHSAERRRDNLLSDFHEVFLPWNLRGTIWRTALSGLIGGIRVSADVRPPAPSSNGIALQYVNI